MISTIYIDYTSLLLLVLIPRKDAEQRFHDELHYACDSCDHRKELNTIEHVGGYCGGVFGATEKEAPKIHDYFV